MLPPLGPAVMEGGGGGSEGGVTSLARPDHNAKAYGLVTLPHRSCSSGMCSVCKKNRPQTTSSNYHAINRNN